MTRLTSYTAMMITVISLMPAANAQPGDWYFASSILYNDDDPDRAVADEVSGIGFNVGRDMTEHLTLDGLLSYSDLEGYVRPSESYPDQKHLDLTANLLAFYDRDRKFAPYALFGVGYLGVDMDPGGSDNGPTVLIGGGFLQRFGDSNLSLRLEVRMRTFFDGQRGLGGTSNLNDYIASIGIQYNFGSRGSNLPDPQSDKPTDTDGDGVLDMWDECANTPKGVNVTARGCEIRGVDRDSDNDRVNDSQDKCPNTPTGVPVDLTGCSLDSDRDGVTTDRDRCPGTRIGAVVDQYGCESDDDYDGVVNSADQCPNTRPRAKVDEDGCEIRDVISLPGVNFQSGSDRLLAGADQLIQEIAATLNANEYLKIEVAGHTDSQGAEIDNQGLSDRRAKTVYDFLITYGVDESRLTFRGYGESQPIADNETAGGRATNRRVELRVLKN